jgi:hypothetical protein
MGMPGTRAQKGKKEMEANKIIITGGCYKNWSSNSQITFWSKGC